MTVIDLRKNMRDEMALGQQIGGNIGSALGYRERLKRQEEKELQQHRLEEEGKLRESETHKQLIQIYSSPGTIQEKTDKVLQIKGLVDTKVGQAFAQNFVDMQMKGDEETEIRKELFEWTKLRGSLDVDDPTYDMYSNMILENTKPLVERLRQIHQEKLTATATTETQQPIQLPANVSMQQLIDDFLTLEDTPNMQKAISVADTTSAPKTTETKPVETKEEKRSLLERFLNKISNGQQVSRTGYSPFPGMPPMSFNKKTQKTKAVDNDISKTVAKMEDETLPGNGTAVGAELQGSIPHPDLTPYWNNMSSEEKQTAKEYLAKGGDIKQIIRLLSQ